MVAKVGHYYGTLFKVHQGITQVDPLSPTIFNIVVVSEICYWVTLVAVEESVPEGFVWEVHWL